MVEVVAGRMYRIADGEDVEIGKAMRTPAGNYEIAGWHVDAQGRVLGCDLVAELLEPSDTETTEDRHAADDQDMQHDGLPRLHERRVQIRQVHALERIADALEVLCGVAMDATDMMGPPEPEGAGGAEERLPGEEPVQ